MPTVRRGRGPYFAQVPWALQDTPDITAPTIAVYAALNRYADWGGDRGCRAAQRTLAEKAGVSVPTLKRHLQELRRLGWIEWASGKADGEPNVYIVHRSLVGGSVTMTHPPSVTMTHRVDHHDPPGSVIMTHNQEPRDQEPLTKRGKSPAAAPPRGARGDGNFFAKIMPLVRRHLYGADGKPPAGWTEAQDCTVARAILKARSLPELEAAIQGFSMLRDSPGVYGDRLGWCEPGDKATLRVFYSQKTATPVPLFNRAVAAYHKAADLATRRDAAPRSPQHITATLARVLDA